jgi:hypothetical protein
LHRKLHKCFLQRDLLEEGNAENLQDFGQTVMNSQFFFDNSDQDVNAHGDPDLRLDGVVGRAEKRLDVQVLFDPFEEQFDLPAALVQFGDCHRVEREVVGQKDQPVFGVGVVITDPAQRRRIILGGARALQQNSLIAAKAGGPVHTPRLDSCIVEIGFGTDDEESHLVCETEESSEVDVAAIHDIEGARLDEQIVEKMNIVHETACNAYKAGNGAFQVHQRVHLDGAFVSAELRPRKQCQTQVDGRRVERISRVIEFDAEAVVDIECSRCGNKPLRKIGVDTPRPFLVGVGECAFGDAAAETGSIKFGLQSPQTGFDVAERLAKSQLGERHAEELIETGKCPCAIVAAITADTVVEVMPGNEVHDLRENDAVGVHQPVLYGCYDAETGCCL